MTRALKYCEDKSWNVVMTLAWNIVMTRVMENCDVRGHEAF